MVGEVVAHQGVQQIRAAIEVGLAQDDELSFARRNGRPLGARDEIRVARQQGSCNQNRGRSGCGSKCQDLFGRSDVSAHQPQKHCGLGAVVGHGRSVAPGADGALTAGLTAGLTARALVLGAITPAAARLAGYASPDRPRA